MDEYIKRDDALLAISYYPIENPEPGDIIQDALETARKAIAKINAADVAPVRHGRWENITGGMITLGDCSECKVRQPVIGTNYCKNCGAKMGGTP